MAQYLWRNGYRAHIAAQVVGEIYDKLHAQYGVVTADHLVSAATDEASPLHDAFEWDDVLAAHEFRLMQARHMLAALRVYDEPVTHTSEPRRYLIAIRPPDSDTFNMRRYEPLAQLMADPVGRQQVLQQALGELRAFERKYRELRELATIFEAIRSLPGSHDEETP